MEIYINETYNAILVKKENKLLAIARAWHEDYISIETSPFEEEIISFEISCDEDALTSNIYIAFSECIDEFISHKQSLGYTPHQLKIDENDRKIEILKSTISNDITIEERENKIIITINNKEKNCQNNRVILDKSGELSYGYFSPLQNLYYKLKSFEQSNTLTKKIDRKN